LVLFHQTVAGRVAWRSRHIAVTDPTGAGSLSAEIISDCFAFIWVF